MLNVLVHNDESVSQRRVSEVWLGPGRRTEAVLNKIIVPLSLTVIQVRSFGQIRLSKVVSVEGWQVFSFLIRKSYLLAAAVFVKISGHCGITIVYHSRSR